MSKKTKPAPKTKSNMVDTPGNPVIEMHLKDLLEMKRELKTLRDIVNTKTAEILDEAEKHEAERLIDNGPFQLKDSGQRQQFGTGAIRDATTGKGRFDLIPAYPLFRLAKLFEAGAKKYSERNWEKGIPLTNFFDSAFRHLMNYADGDRTEDHLIAVCWNMFGFLWTEEMIARGELPKTLNNYFSPRGPNG